MRNPEAIASPKRVFLAAALSAALGLSLCFGFFSLSFSPAHFLQGFFGGSRWLWEIGAYLTLCILFARLFAPPSQKTQGQETHWVSLLLPILIAFLFGYFDGFPGLKLLAQYHPSAVEALAWATLVSPVGEELLFRGGVYRTVDAIYPNQLASATNPLPLAVWGSALAFSLWHIQNGSDLGAIKTLFQCAYTLPVGLWLGWLRWRTGSLVAPLVAHTAINVSAVLA